MEGWYHHSRGSNDWDLNAVVRYACGGRVSPPTSSGDPFSSFFPPPPPQQEVKDEALPQVATSLPDDLPFNGDAAVLDELSIAFFGVSARPGPPQPQQQQQQLAAATDEETLQPQQDDAVSPPVPQTSGRQASGGEGSRSKRKKKQVKKVVKRVAADGVSADPWAWRKYGQKPIKGSPYPRGYYRCSTDKACAARKMVERCRSDPDSFILTYTGGDHSHPVPIHRNSLAGTTRIRQQRAEPPSCGQSAPGGATATAEPSPGQSTSGGMSTSPTTTSPRSPSMEEEECNQEEAECDEAGGASKDVEMAGEEDDELKTFLGTYDQPAMVVDGGVSSRHARMNDDDGAAARVSPLLNVVEETFVVSPWVTALGDATGWS